MRLRTLIMVAARRTLGYRTVLWALGLAMVCSGVLGVALPYWCWRGMALHDAAAMAMMFDLSDEANDDPDRLATAADLTGQRATYSGGKITEWGGSVCRGAIISPTRSLYLTYYQLKGGEGDYERSLRLTTTPSIMATASRLRQDQVRPFWMIYVECGFPFLQQSGCIVEGYKDRFGQRGASRQYDSGVVFLKRHSALAGIENAFEARPVPTWIKPLGLLLNVLCYAGVILMVFAAVNFFRVARRVARGVCVHCGYSRAPGRCPECGGVAGASL